MIDHASQGLVGEATPEEPDIFTQLLHSLGMILTRSRHISNASGLSASIAHIATQCSAESDIRILHPTSHHPQDLAATVGCGFNCVQEFVIPAMVPTVEMDFHRHGFDCIQI